MGRRQAPIGWHLPEFRPLARPLARPPLLGNAYLRVGSAARMRVQVQVRLATLPETPLYKAI